MNSTERYEGTDKRIYTIEFLGGRFVVHCIGEMFVMGKIPDPDAQPLARDKLARLAVIQR